MGESERAPSLSSISDCCPKHDKIPQPEAVSVYRVPPNSGKPTEHKTQLTTTARDQSSSPQSTGAQLGALPDYTLRLDPPHRVRNYQWELAVPGIEGKNYIICAPTGTGKTLVAALVISEHLKMRGPKGKVVFLVDKRPLAQQQRDAIQKHIPGATVECCTGEDTTLAVQTLLKHSNVVVCTDGKFLYELRGDKIKFEEISLMIFDECHHTRKSTSYANIMAKYLEESAMGGRLPQVIGMTASPGAGTRLPELDKILDHLITLCALLNATSGIKIVKDNINELDSYTNKTTFTLRRVS